MNKFFSELFAKIIIFIFLGFVIYVISLLLDFLNPFLRLIAGGIIGILGIAVGLGAIAIAYITLRDSYFKLKRKEIINAFFILLGGSLFSLYLASWFYEIYSKMS